MAARIRSTVGAKVDAVAVFDGDLGFHTCGDLRFIGRRQGAAIDIREFDLAETFCCQARLARRLFRHHARKPR